MTPEEFETLTGRPLASAAFDCHGASLQLVRALRAGGELLGLTSARVARGNATGMFSQHSWVVLGHDCYDRKTRILDPTLWCYEEKEPYVWEGTLADGVHHPHGAGSVWNYGRPPPPTGPKIELAVDPGEVARMFLEMAAPDGLDRRGWEVLLHGPVNNWPAREIIEAALDTPALTAILPVDIVGMVTDRNPGGLYW